MKRKIALLMSMVLLMSTLQMNFVFANEETVQDVNTTDTVVEENKIMNLSMDDAVKLAKESSREMWKIDDGLKQAKEASEKGYSDKEQAETLMSFELDNPRSTSNTDIYVEALLAKKGYYITLADTKTKELKKKRELLNLSIEIETKSLYYQVLVAEKTIEINEGNLSNAKEQLRVINLKFNNGSATKAEVLNGEMAIQKAQTDLDSSKDDLEVAKLNLLNEIDLPFDTTILLTDKTLSYVPTVGINLETALEKAKTDRPEILTAANNLELQNKETQAYTSYYTPNLRQNKSAVEKLKDAELNVPQVYKNVELDVRKSYLNLIKAERALVNMDKTVELAKEAARINKLLYENGMVASLDVLEANTQLAQAEIGRYQLLISYNISKMMFDNSNLVGSSTGM